MKSSSAHDRVFHMLNNDLSRQVSLAIDDHMLELVSSLIVVVDEKLVRLRRWCHPSNLFSATLRPVAEARCRSQCQDEAFQLNSESKPAKVWFRHAWNAEIVNNRG